MGVRHQRVRAGIVGAGLMGRWHADTVRRVGAEVVAVADPNAAAAAQLAGCIPNAAVFSDVDEMLAREIVEVLHVCTPLHTHVPIAEKALEAGCHLLVEKPLAPTAAETEQLFVLAENKGRLLCPVHQFLFQDGVRRTIDWLPQVGRVLHIRGVFYSAGGVGRSKEELDEIVADILPHPLSLFRELLQGGLEAAGWQTIHPAPGEFYSQGEVAGTVISIEISMSARPTVAALEVGGTEGTVYLDLFHGYAFLQPGRVSRAHKIAHPFQLAARRLGAATTNLIGRAWRKELAYPGLRQLIHLFYTAVKDGSSPPIARETVQELAVSRDMIKSQLESYDDNRLWVGEDTTMAGDCT